MVEILREYDNEARRQLGAGEKDMVYTARCDGELIGKCIYHLEGECVVLDEIDTLGASDVLLADGLGRAALASVEAFAKYAVQGGGGAELETFCRNTGAFEGKKAEIAAILKSCCGRA